LTDTTAPVLLGLNYPNFADVKNGKQSLTISVSVSDEGGSGVNQAVIYLQRSLTDSYSFVGLWGYGDDWTDGKSSATISFETYSAPGLYKVDHVDLTDKAGNKRTYQAFELAALGFNTSLEVFTDSYRPTAGEDVMTGSNLADALEGKGGNDRIDGLDGNDSLYGGDGNDTLIGGAGKNLLDGGAGDDVIFGVFGDTIFGGEGNDMITVGPSLEALRYWQVSVLGGGGDDYIKGSDEAEFMDGGVGNDTIVGGMEDTIAGGDGDDLIFIALTSGAFSYSNRDIGGAGHDTLVSSGGFTLSATNSVEVLRTSAMHGVSLAGNQASNEIVGTAFDDILSSGGGADTLNGGAGNDVYDATQATVIQDSSGRDHVRTSESYKLPTGIENLSVSWQASTGLTLRGNSDKNVLTGSWRNDKFYTGGGADSVTTGGGRDTIAFDVKPSKANVVKITDFGGGDKLWIENKIFTKLGKKGSEKKPYRLSDDKFSSEGIAMDGDDRIAFNSRNGKLFYDPDGDGGQKQVHVATLQKHAFLEAKSIYII
jgi:Ca2+-binding RTX toxin-like protein